MSSTSDIIQEARHRLHAALNRKAARINLRLNSGELVMYGKLATYYQKQLAQEAVRHVDGIEQVTNRIEVV